MKNRKRGFTLIELLGVIIIVSLLVLIITPVVNNIIKDSKDKLYDKTLENIKLAAKNWASDSENKDLLPDDISNCVVVTLAQLKAGGYIDLDIKDPRNGQKLSDDITVIVTKNTGRYDYELSMTGVTPDNCYIERPDPTAPIITANIFEGYRSTFPLAISYSDEYGLKSTNSYQYYLSSSYNSLEDGNWVNYTKDVVQNIGSGLNGKYYLYVRRIYNTKDIISSLGGTIINIGSDSYQRFGPYNFDSILPTWSLVNKTNTNTSGNTALEKLTYAYKNDTVTFTIRGTDNNFDSCSLTADQIGILVNGVTDSSISKTVSSAKNVNNGVEYTISLTNFEKSGDITLTIPANTLTDKALNKNNQSVISTGIKANGCIYTLNTTWTYNTPGSVQQFIAPCKGTYKIEVVGGDGWSQNGGNNGGRGAYVYGDISLSKDTLLYVNVGGVGTTAGGANGGGTNGGGGSSDVRVGSGTIAERIIVAGGGGGGVLVVNGHNVKGGDAGLAEGQSGNAEEGHTECFSCTGNESNQGAFPGAQDASCPSVSYCSSTPSSVCIGRIPTGGNQSSGGLHGVSWHCSPRVGYWSGYDGQLYYGGNGGAASQGGGGGYYGGGGAAISATHHVTGAGGSSCISGNPNYNCNVSGYTFTNYGGKVGDAVDDISSGSNDIVTPNASRQNGDGIVKITLVSLN